MENYRDVCGVIFIILSSMLYNSSGNEVQTDLQKFKALQRTLLAEILERQLLEEKLSDAERKYPELVEAVKRVVEKPEFRLPEHVYDVVRSSDVEGRFEKKVDAIVETFTEATSILETVTTDKDEQTAEKKILDRQLLEEKLSDAERKYAELVEHVYDVVCSRDVEGRFEKKVDAIVETFTEPTSILETVTTYEDKQTAERKQSHFDDNGVNDLPDLSCHVKDQCNNKQFHAKTCSVIISREDWGARDTRSASYMTTLVSTIFIHHTAMDRCYFTQDCIFQMQKIQDLHMDKYGWDDIGYSFVVGDDGMVYEARGWDRVGAHTRGWNSVSISIAVMGNFNDVLPSKPAVQAIDSLIECGIIKKKVAPGYKLYGHRAASPNFDSPGHMFNELIQEWAHYTKLLPSSQ